MQPLLTHVPPNRLRSIIATFIPVPASRTARDGPAWPVPITIASYLVAIGIPPLGFGRLQFSGFLPAVKNYLHASAAQTRGTRAHRRARPENAEHPTSNIEHPTPEFSLEPWFASR